MSFPDHLRVDMSKNAPAAEKNKRIWSSNLVRFRKRMKSRKHSTLENLDQMRKIPTELIFILNRHKTLASDVKGRKKRIAQRASEEKQLWKKMTANSIR